MMTPPPELLPDELKRSRRIKLKTVMRVFEKSHRREVVAPAGPTSDLLAGPWREARPPLHASLSRLDYSWV
ncbi:unnamed protein product [Caenorhabditis auriculariae]|uniref:Uncharacterized protein n=1 Tax=Caenorhabditis auriculariae TaxID=2777116 RepID=A0A8S1HVP7_9PELO|nr:unnamed protein product [Caenorhabditis auriculariae]